MAEQVKFDYSLNGEDHERRKRCISREEWRR